MMTSFAGSWTLNAVFQLIDEGKSPVVIHMESGNDFLVFGWEDYFERFGIDYVEHNAILAFSIENVVRNNRNVFLLISLLLSFPLYLPVFPSLGEIYSRDKREKDAKEQGLTPAP